jgi:hypothetical protein
MCAFYMHHPLRPLQNYQTLSKFLFQSVLPLCFEVCSDTTNPSAVICHPGRASLPCLLLSPSSLMSLSPMLGECRRSPLHASSDSLVSPSLPWSASAGKHALRQQPTTGDHRMRSPSSLHQRFSPCHRRPRPEPRHHGALPASSP